MDYVRPQTVAEAVQVLAQAGSAATVVAGGTDIVGDIKFRGLKPVTIVNINRLEGLRYISEGPDGLRIGALTNIQQLVGNPIVLKSYTALGDAAERFASLQVRNLATVAGSLGRASPGGDMAPPLMALGATVIAVGPAGEREIDLADFFLGPRRTVLAPGELMREIRVPAPGARSGSAYARLSYRDVLDLCIVGVATGLALDAGNVVTTARLALGSVAAKPVRAANTEAFLLGKVLTDDVIREAGNVASTDCNPITDQRASAEYRKQMVPVLTRRSLARARDAALG